MKELYEFLVKNKISGNPVHEYALVYRKRGSIKEYYIRIDDIDEYDYFIKYMKENTEYTMYNLWNKNIRTGALAMKGGTVLLMPYETRKNRQKEITVWSTRYYTFKELQKTEDFKETAKKITLDKFNIEYWRKNNWTVY